RTVRAMNHRDLGIGKLDALIYLRDGGIVPFGDLAEIDVGEERTGQLEFAGLHAYKIDDRNIAADDGRKLQQAVFFELFRFERHVRRTEIDRLVLDLLDTPARADRLVIHADTRLRLVGFGPLRVNRVGKRGAGAGNVETQGGRADAERQRGSKKRVGAPHDWFLSSRSDGDHCRARTLHS